MTRNGNFCHKIGKRMRRLRRYECTNAPIEKGGKRKAISVIIAMARPVLLRVVSPRRNQKRKLGVYFEFGCITKTASTNNTFESFSEFFHVNCLMLPQCLAIRRYFAANLTQEMDAQI